MIISKSPEKYYYIEEEKSLSKLLGNLQKISRIALDTEADSLHSYYEKTCLIQLTFNGNNYIIDPLSEIDLSSFLEAIKDKAMIFHGGDYDLRMLRQCYNFEPEGTVFDTMLAAQLLGYEKLGLAALLDHFFDVKLEKETQKSDWSRRPLSEEQLKYACYDTYFLEQLANILEKELKEKGRHDWFCQHCSNMVQLTTVEKEVKTDDQWRVKGYHELTPSQLRFLKAIWQWRDEMARKEDVPPFRIMRTQLMIRIAKWLKSNSHKSVAEFPGLPRNFTITGLPVLDQNIAEAVKIPKNDWPSRFKKRERVPFTPEDKDLIETIKSECSKIAAENNLPLSVIISRSRIGSISKLKPKTKQDLMKIAGIQKWQADLIYEPVSKILKQSK